MKERSTIARTLYIIGIVALAIGALDPMEGSIVIAVGSILMAVSTYLIPNPHQTIFRATAAMIVVGVCFLFFFSALGGFGGKSQLSWWWATLILPYPIGWLINIITLLRKSTKEFGK